MPLNLIYDEWIMPDDPRPKLVGGEVDGAVAPIPFGVTPRSVDVPLVVSVRDEKWLPGKAKPDPGLFWEVGTRFKNVGSAHYELNDARTAYLHVETQLRSDAAQIVDGEQ
jgi:hypothetical protein